MNLIIIYTSKQFLWKLEKEYRDCIKRKGRQDWDMNETLSFLMWSYVLRINEKEWHNRIPDQTPILLCSGVAISLVK